MSVRRIQREILDIFDKCCDDCTFPMLDNGYIFPAAALLTLFRSSADWAMVIETFGFFNRTQSPLLFIDTFASRPRLDSQPEDFVSREAYDKYLLDHAHHASHSMNPIAEGSWRTDDYSKYVADSATDVVVRQRTIELPPVSTYLQYGIELEEPPRVHVFELCRYLAAVARDDVLATPDERRFNLAPELSQILQLEEWHHPDLADEERASDSMTFRQLAEVLVTGDTSAYHPHRKPNTHWSHWPEGGRL